MAEKDNKSKIQETIGFNEDKTAITYTLMSDDPITEEEFLFCMSDFIKCFGDGFQFAEVGELIPFDMFNEEDPPDGIYH